MKRSAEIPRMGDGDPGGQWSAYPNQTLDGASTYEPRCAGAGELRTDRLSFNEEGFYREPSRIDADHLTSSRNSSAHSCAADAGHSTLTVPPRRFTSMRIVTGKVILTPSTKKN